LEGLQSYWRSSEGSEPRRSMMGFRALGWAWRVFRDFEGDPLLWVMSCICPTTIMMPSWVSWSTSLHNWASSKIKLGLFLLHDVALLHGRTSSMMSEQWWVHNINFY
jgi:uncharacterized protein (DUF983 family)